MYSLNEQDINSFKKDGCVIIDNFLPLNIVDELELSYSDEESWDYYHQIRELSYGGGKYGKHQISAPHFPNKSEVYSAKFYRSGNLEKNTEQIFNQYILPIIKKFYNVKDFKIRCYKMKSGCYYRTHSDNYAGRIGFTFYINKHWIWDWGGILNIYLNKKLVPIFPKYNRLVLMNNEHYENPHFISSIEEYALQDRYTLVGFEKGVAIETL
tara:strand:+ start:691 stop:1323 length:633 start_codon:yes stop_codon:yes gene_type:complete